MPKLKTNKAAAKRFKITGSGKIMRLKAYKSHILTKKNTERKRRLSKQVEVPKSEAKKIKKLLGVWVVKIWWIPKKKIKSLKKRCCYV